MKFLIYFFFILVSSFEITLTADFECIYQDVSWNYIGLHYRCFIQNDPNILSIQDATIKSLSGQHLYGKNNDNVNNFHITGKNLHFFPQSLDKFFKNLKAIVIGNSKLKEIHQYDLKPFKDLVMFLLHNNDIEILEEGLFDFNPNLVYIEFSNNKISHIYPYIFDNLVKLVSLYLSSNKCISMMTENDGPKVKNIIEAVKSQCSMPLTSTAVPDTTTTSTTIIPVACPAPVTENPNTLLECQSQVAVLNTEIKDLKNNSCIRELNKSLIKFQDHIQSSLASGIVQKFDQSLKDSQTLKNETLNDVNERLEFIEDRMNNLVNVNTKSFNELNTKFLEMQYKMDLRLKRMEGMLLKQNEEKFEKLEEKLMKILKSLNISD